MFILPDAIHSTLKKIENTLTIAASERSFISLKAHIKQGEKSLIKKRKFATTISDLTRHLQKHLSKQTIDSICAQAKLCTPCSKDTLAFYSKVLIPAWKEMQAGNILPLCNHFFQLQSTPALLSLTSSLVLFANEDKININELKNIELNRAQFYINELLDGNLLVETLEDSII